MFDIVLYQPEIPPNTGNIIRLAANTGCRLHLVKPLGFTLAHKQLRRAGLDYHDLARLRLHESWPDCRASFAGRRIFALSTRGQGAFYDTAFHPDDVFLFGAETAGLPTHICADPALTAVLALPMQPANRSLNLSNTVAVTVFEAWRQNGFWGCRQKIL